MRILNQLDYENILYPTSLVKGEQPAEPYPSVAKAGCGLICACMLVSILTDKQLEPQEAVRISVRAGANHFGTDMPIFAKEIAERYGLELSSGSSKEELMNGLRTGAVAIIHAGKPKGLFSDGGHFVLAAKAEGENIYIIDPSFKQEKYDKDYRQGLFTMEPPYIVVSADNVMDQIKYRMPPWYLFRKHNK